MDVHKCTFFFFLATHIHITICLYVYIYIYIYIYIYKCTYISVHTEWLNERGREKVRERKDERVNVKNRIDKSEKRNSSADMIIESPDNDVSRDMLYLNFNFHFIMLTHLFTRVRSNINIVYYISVWWYK